MFSSNKTKFQMVPKNITLKIILLNIFKIFISRTCELQLQYQNPGFFLYYCKIQQHTIQKLLLVVFCNVKFLC